METNSILSNVSESTLHSTAGLVIGLAGGFMAFTGVGHLLRAKFLLGTIEFVAGLACLPLSAVEYQKSIDANEIANA